MLKKRTRPKMGVRQDETIRSPAHLAFVRSFECAVAHNLGCEGPIQAAHLRKGTTGGALSKKPDDCWCVPLCLGHHASQHGLGERSFERKHNIDLRALAEELWRRSPARLKMERQK